jgi:hypothetical protein
MSKMALRPEMEKKLRAAIKHFWSTRETQAELQGAKTGVRDSGARTAVTGGHQMDGFIGLVRDHLCANGLLDTDGRLRLWRKRGGERAPIPSGVRPI